MRSPSGYQLVRRQFNPPAFFSFGGVAQLAEHLLCKQTVAGSKPVTSTIFLGVAHLVERVLWEHEARGSSPLTETIFRLILDR